MNITSLYEGHILKGRYVIQSLLGKGGMGQVYLAQDLRLQGKYWAIKEVKIEIEHKKFIDEARMLAELDHPSLPQIVDYYPADEQGYCFIVMDYIQGRSIADYYEKEHTPFSLTKILQYMRDLCGVFIYLHNHQPYPIIYRDLKPTNIMIDRNQQIKLIDFGIARLFHQEKTEDTVQIGTIGFAAPEQYSNQQTDQRTDIYQLGAMLQYFLSGAPPHLAAGKAEQDSGVVERMKIGSRTAEEQQYDQGLREIIYQATQYNPEDRYQSVSEMLEDIERIDQNVRRTKSVLALKGLNSVSSTTNQSGIKSNLTENLRSKYILIGSLWRGAGSTTLATNLARSLASKKLGVAYVEYPTIQPYMFDYLNISDKEIQSGQKYQDIQTLLTSQRSKTTERAWQEQDITWLVIDPRTIQQSWTYEDMLELTQILRHYQVTIIDVSNHWLHPSLSSFVEYADHVFLCVEPNPSKVDWLNDMEHPSVYDDQVFPHNYQESASRILSALQDLESQGKCDLEYISMKMNSSVSARRWNECLPKPPLASMPYLPYPVLMKSIWNSTFIYDQADYLTIIEEFLSPIMEQIIPNISKIKIEDSEIKVRIGLKKWKSFISLHRSK